MRPKLGNSCISMRVMITSILLWEGNLGLALGMTLKLYTSVTKWLKLKVKRFLGLIP